MKTNRKLNKIMLAMILATIPSPFLSANALETSIAALTTPKGDFYLELDQSEHSDERKEVQKLLDAIENQWNSHNLELLMSNYSDDYINNDGLNKKAVEDLTKDFWEQYPDAKSASKTKEIRIDDMYATVDSRDIASGTTAKEIPGINGKGELQSVSEGQLYLRKFGDGWKIIGDRIDYEKVKVSYGLAKEIEAAFIAPEQIKAGKKYAAKLDVKMPNGLVAVGEITSQNLRYPSAQSAFPNSPATEVWKPLEQNALDKDSYVLERMLEANAVNHNELLMTTVGITNAARNSLVGLEFLTRRLNVVPPTTDEPPDTEVAAAEAKKAVKAIQENKKGAGETSSDANQSNTKPASAPATKSKSTVKHHSGATHKHKTNTNTNTNTNQ